MGELDMEVSTLVLQAVLQAQEDETKKEHRSCFGSDHEAWATLKEHAERAAKAAEPVAKLHKEMWDAVKDHNQDQALADLQAMKNSAIQTAMEWIRFAAQAARAIEG